MAIAEYNFVQRRTLTWGSDERRNFTALVDHASGPRSHSFDSSTQFPATAGQSGLAEFYGPSGTFSILALKFNSGAFTTAPVYAVSGAPIIASGTGGDSPAQL